jgi:hypothetical protein
MSGRRISQRLTQRLRRLEVRRTCRFEALACTPARPKHQERSPAAQGERGADRGRGRAHGGNARRSLARWTHQQVFIAIAGIASPAARSVERTGATGSDGKAPRAFGDLRNLPRTSICPPRFRLRHRLRGRPTLHPEGCSSSCCSSSSMPSRMNDEAFLYLVYGTSSLMNSHVA